MTVKPYGVAAVTHGVDGGPGLSGLVVQTSTSLGLLLPSVFEATSCERQAVGEEGEKGGRAEQRSGLMGAITICSSTCRSLCSIIT